MKRFAAVVVLASSVMALLAAEVRPPETMNTGSTIVIHGTILTLDRAHNVARIHHAATETMPASDKTCRLRRRDVLQTLHVGDTIEAFADTMHSPWMLDRVRIIKRG